MRHKQLGSTGITVPEIAFGTWRYSGGVKPLQAAIEHGAAFIDTAEIYGSEETVGEAIGGRRDQVFLTTKVAPRNYRRREIALALENSLKRLRTNYVDLYQLHWPNYLVPVAEPLSAMEDLVAAGKIRFIGVSNFSVRELRQAQLSIRCPIVSNQVKYSLLDRTVETNGMLRYVQEHSITLLAYSPLGHLFNTFDEADREQVLGKIAARLGKTRPQVALNWLIRQKNVIAIPKASSPSHVIEDCGASGWVLDDNDSTFLENHIRHRSLGMVSLQVRRWKRVAAQFVGRSI